MLPSNKVWAHFGSLTQDQRPAMGMKGLLGRWVRQDKESIGKWGETFLGSRGMTVDEWLTEIVKAGVEVDELALYVMSRKMQRQCAVLGQGGGKGGRTDQAGISTRKLLRQHQNLHTAADDEYKCACGLAYRGRSGLYYHMKREGGEKAGHYRVKEWEEEDGADPAIATTGAARDSTYQALE